MTGEKGSSDLSSRLGVKRGGKLISKTLRKSASPPSISAPPKAAVSASKVKKDEVQRRKNSFHDMFKGSARDAESGLAPLLKAPATNTTSPSADYESRAVSSSTAALAHGVIDSRDSFRRERAPIAEGNRIAELEDALARAREQTAAVRQELERVKQDAQASIEITKYQAAGTHVPPTSPNAISTPHFHHNRAEETFDREAELLDHNSELRSRVTELEEQLIVQSTYRPSQALHSEEDWDTLTLRLHEIEKESNSRLKQLLSLKSSISSLTRADVQVSDSELADEFSQLANRVREWVVSNYRRTKMSFDDLPEGTVQMLRSIKTNYEDTAPTDKLALYQAIVSCVLMRIFAEPLAVGMPDQGVFAGLRAFSEHMQLARNECWEWRRTTLRLIETSTQASTTQKWRISALDRLAIDLEAAMRSMTSTDFTSSARSAMLSIMNTAADLQRTLCLQKATYSVVFFGKLQEKRDHFDDYAMEPINDLEYVQDDDGELSQQCEFNFCVFPCLEKVDNDIEHIVFRARVCCGVG